MENENVAWADFWEDDEPEQEEKQPFEVDDDGKAEWCLKKIAEAEAEKARWKEHYAAQLDRVSARLDGSIGYFKAKLFEYFNTVPHKTTKTQESYALPGGKLIMKKQQPKFEKDNDVLVAWLESSGMGDLVKVSKTADWAGLKKGVTVHGENLLTRDGEIVPGVTVIELPDVFEVKAEA